MPDFRLSPDPYISFEDEYEKARALADKAEQLSFEALLRFYWDITPDVSRPSAERFIRYALSGEERAKGYLETIDTHVQGQWGGDACLEVGCGTGGFLLAAQARFRVVVGADIALRWLIIAKKRLKNTAKHILLVACSAEHLPFPDQAFDGVIGLHMLEHTKDPQAVVSETTRTLKRNGLCFYLTPNRFSLGPEPCVRVWGVGYVPRALAERYVKLMNGGSYKHICLLSPLELRRLLARSGLRQWLISPARITECERKLVSRFGQVLIIVYHALREFPFCSFLLQAFGPFLQVLGRK